MHCKWECELIVNKIFNKKEIEYVLSQTEKEKKKYN